MADGLVPCTRMFSNGSEYEWFIENNCMNGCTRFRKGYCRIFRMTEKARFDPKYFPYDALLQYERYAGMECKHYTTAIPSRKRKPKLIEGQLTMEQLVR